MASKLYLHAATTTVAGTLPAAGVSVSATTPTKIGSGVNRSLSRAIGALQTSQAITTNATVSAQPSLMARWISDPVSAQTFSSQAIGFHIGGSESGTNSNLRLRSVVALWRPSSGTNIGVLTDLAATATLEPGTTQTALNGTTASSTSQTAIDGDVLIVEIWRDSTVEAAATAFTNTIFYDGTTEDSTTTNAAYVNFANTITFLGDGYGQAQAKITGSPGFAQANALISRTASSVADTFTRTTSSGWGTADTGGAWTIIAGTAADFSTSGTEAVISPAAPSSHYIALDGVLLPRSTEGYVKFKLTLPTSSILGFRINTNVGSSEDSNVVAGSTAQLNLNASGTLFTSAALNDQSQSGSSFPYVAGDYWYVKWRTLITDTETTIWMKSWKATDPEPGWDNVFSGAKLFERGHVRIATSSSTGSATVTIDDLNVYAASPVGNGQANADINATSLGFGQAQAQITRPSASGVGQAQAFIAGPIVLHVCGAECRLVDSTSMGSSESQHYTSITGTAPTVETTNIDSAGGTAAFNFTTAGSPVASSLNKTLVYSGLSTRSIVGRFAFRLSNLPSSGSVTVARAVNSQGNFDFLVDSTGAAFMKIGSAAAVQIGSYSVTTGVYHRFDFVINASTGTASFKVSINDTNETTTTRAQSASTVTSWQIGPLVSPTASTTYLYDNILITGFNTTNYPLGAGKILGFVPTAVGTHSFTLGEYRDETDASLSTSETTSWSRLTDVPDDGSTSYVYTFSPASSTSYVEYVYANTTEKNNPRAVVQMASTGYGLECCDYWVRFQLNDGTISTDAFDPLHIFNIGGSGFAVRQRIWQGTPSSSTWTVSNFNNLRIRFGFYISNHRTGITNTVLEAEFPIITPRAFGQAQADIKAVGRGFAQAQADIKATGRGFGQSQADVKAVSWGFGQAQSDIKAISFGLAQAQSTIKAIGVTGLGQAQADIKATSSGFAQSQADIKATSFSFGQAQADIKATSYGLAQAQSDIKATSFGLGQAQADVKATSYGLAQANADIKVTSTGFGQTQADIKATSNAFAQAQADIRASGFGFGQAQADIKAISYVESQAQADIKSTSYASAQAQATVQGASSKFAQAQATILATSFAFGQSNADINATSFGEGQAQGKINAFGVNTFGQAQADVKGAEYPTGQAQAKINAFGVNASGQAQADIKSISYGEGQSQADILVSNYVEAQAQANISQTSFGLAQAQASIKATNYGEGQAQAKLNAFGVNRYAQAQANIAGQTYPSGQAQAKINAFGVNAFGQAQADIKAVGYGAGQAQTDVKASEFGWAQAQSDIKVTEFAEAQAQADVKATSFANGQAQADIKATSVVEAQSQADIKATSFGEGQAQTDIKQTSFSEAQAQANIVAVGYGKAQAAADILATSNKEAQAQADIKSTGFAEAQAQADIKITSFASAQAQANISHTSFVEAQAQSSIKAVSSSLGQANADIFATSYRNGQAQADIKSTTQQYGQAQVYIKARIASSGQAQADINVVTSRTGQAQADVKQTYNGAANAQTDIRATINNYGQSNASIISATNVLAQAQAYILNGIDACGQAQAQILASSLGFGQAQAFILKSAGYGQASARVIIAHTLKTVIGSDRASLLLSGSDRAIVVASPADKAMKILGADKPSLAVNASDRSVISILGKDEAY